MITRCSDGIQNSHLDEVNVCFGVQVKDVNVRTDVVNDHNMIICIEGI